MEPRRSLKRKHYEVLKNDLSVELSKLTIDSGNLHTDLQSANEDFELMCRSMADRQADFLTRSLLLEEKYGEVMAVLDGKTLESKGESSGENVVLPTSYAETFHRFVTDSRRSLLNHGVLIEDGLKDMAKVFEKYDAIWKQQVLELKERAGLIDKKRAQLSTKLLEFNSYTVDDSDTE